MHVLKRPFLTYFWSDRRPSQASLPEDPPPQRPSQETLPGGPPRRPSQETYPGDLSRRPSQASIPEDPPPQIPSQETQPGGPPRRPFQEAIPGDLPRRPFQQTLLGEFWDNDYTLGSATLCQKEFLCDFFYSIKLKHSWTWFKLWLIDLYWFSLSLFWPQSFQKL